MTSKIVLLAFLVSAVPTFAADGEAVFKANCARCHGDDGKGKTKVAPPDLTDPKTQASLTDADIVKTIKNGWKGKLSAEEISAVAAYVRSLGRSAKGGQ